MTELFVTEYCKKKNKQNTDRSKRENTGETFQ